MSTGSKDAITFIVVLIFMIGLMELTRLVKEYVKSNK
jgi:hypothetical protein